MQRKRWGKKFVDKRDWVKYNEELVVRGEFLLDMKWTKSWNKELDQMNKGKVGAKYAFPESLIKLQAVWHQWVDYRGVEGITRQLKKHKLVPQYNDFSTINRRVNRLDTDIELPKRGKVSVACDGSGMKMTNSGQYRENKYGRTRKKYIKVVITADPIRKKLLGCYVEIEGKGLSEPMVAESYIKEFTNHGFDVDKFWGDGSFDTIFLHDLLKEHNIENIIKPRTTATCDEPFAANRKKAVKNYKKKGYKKWAKEKRYGLRWVGTEGMFSAVKRKFGENVRSTKIRNMLREVQRKFWAYDLLQAYAAA